MDTKNKKTKFNLSLEGKALAVLAILFVGVIFTAWGYSINLNQTLTSTPSAAKADVKALVEIEKIRNLANAQISNSLNFFLMGSSSLFDEQKNQKQLFAEALDKFEKEHNFPKVPEIIGRIKSLQTQQQDYFDQGMEFRAKQTESKIVGQFYRSKTNSIGEQINKALDEIVVLHNAEFERARAEAQEAADGVQTKIPMGMTWFTSVLAVIFFAMCVLVVRMLNQRSRQIAERTRLYEEAQKAVQSRDEVMAAISQDLKEPLQEIHQSVERIAGEPANIHEAIDLIRNSVTVTEDRIKDILDQTKRDTGTLLLRMDQLPIDSVLEEARQMLLPLAKQKDIRLEFNSVNPPALAFLDRERVMRVLSNLIGNSIKFSPRQSKVIVKVKSDQQFVFISIKDEGPGIPEKQLSDVFENFWQARKTADQGPGLGLAIVKTIIEAHGGSVTVDSHVGHGSTFTFSLPKRRPAGAQMGKPAANPAVRKTTWVYPKAGFEEGPNR